MKTKYSLTLLMALMLTINACKKSSSNDGENKPPLVTKYLTQDVSVVLVGGTNKVTVTTNYTYDAKKRLTTKNDGTFILTYTYYDNNKVYNLDQSSAINGTRLFLTEYTYTDNRLSRELKKVYKNGSVGQEITTDYVYNGDKISEVHNSAGVVTLNTYDGQGDLVKVENKAPEFTTTYVYTYDSNHRKVSENVSYSTTNLKPTSTTYAYDSHNNITKTVLVTAVATVTVNTTNTYDADGYLTSKISDNGTSTVYTYSTLN
jgi:YD repeat-containing protein